MQSFKLKYGGQTVTIPVADAKSVVSLQEKPIEAITDIKEAFIAAVTKNCIASEPLDKKISADDKITVVISDITRFWMHQDVVTSQLIDFLHGSCGVPYGNIVILVALGTHRSQTEDELKTLVTPEIYQKVQVINHDCDAKDLVYLGKTSWDTEVYVNPLAVGRKVILIGGTVHHIMAGFGGGRKSILPGIAGRQTINHNHLYSLNPTEERSSELIGTGALIGNPLNEDMIEAAAFVDPVFGINIITNPKGAHCRLVCGHWHKAWEKSCDMVQEYFGVPIEHKADIVIASCGGYPKDINLYQSTKTLFNACQAAKEGGTIILLAECREGGGAPEFFDWTHSLKRGTLDPDLRAGFSIPGYIFYAACERTRMHNLLMLSELPNDTVKDMNIRAFSDIEALLSNVDFKDKDVYVMQYGGNTVPYIK